MTETYKKLKIIVLESEGKKYVQCRCPDPNHVKGNDNSDITLERVLQALVKKSEQFAAFKMRPDWTQVIMFGNCPSIFWDIKKPAHLQLEDTQLKLIDILK